MRLYVVRHGQTSWNVEGRAQGHVDIPLNEEGHGQAAAVGVAFRDIRIDRILSSDLLRAVQTAERIHEATGIPIEFRRDLRERCFGAWEGDDFAAVGARSAAIALAEGVSFLKVRPPGGESLADVWRRMSTVSAEIDRSDQALAVITHGGALSILLARLFRGNLETSRSFRFANTSITELERRKDGYYAMVRYGDTSHLNRAPATEPVGVGDRGGR